MRSVHRAQREKVPPILQSIKSASQATRASIRAANRKVRLRDRAPKWKWKFRHFHTRENSFVTFALGETAASKTGNELSTLALRVSTLTLLERIWLLRLVCPTGRYKNSICLINWRRSNAVPCLTWKSLVSIPCAVMVLLVTKSASLTTRKSLTMQGSLTLTVSGRI